MVLRSIKAKLKLVVPVFFGLSLIASSASGEAEAVLGRAVHLNLRTRVQPFKTALHWNEVDFQEEFLLSETAIVICDMWDSHWCTGAARRVDILARKMAPVINEARNYGILIIHAPSDTMSFYKDYPQRKQMLEIAKVDPPADLDLSTPRLPIDDSDGGCDTTPPDKFYPAWTRENAAIRIGDSDLISDDGDEIYSLLRQRAIKNLLVMGVHTNMCVLNRPFAIQQMTKRGIRCMLVRDLTDSLYNPKDRPYVPHDQATELVVEYIEKYWCPSVLGSDLVRVLEHAE
jgi:nicotinamidase-related amidase